MLCIFCVFIFNEYININVQVPPLLRLIYEWVVVLNMASYPSFLVIFFSFILLGVALLLLVVSHSQPLHIQSRPLLTEPQIPKHPKHFATSSLSIYCKYTEPFVIKTLSPFIVK